MMIRVWFGLVWFGLAEYRFRLVLARTERVVPRPCRSAASRRPLAIRQSTVNIANNAHILSRMRDQTV
eukprot:scaffold1171_cov177-Amphora_coffeaeformis.AAC.17